jgi:SSS family solute:Na+ symporter
LLAFAVVAVYVYAGGLRAIGWVAVVKGCLMAGVGLLIVVRVVSHYYGGVTEMFAQLAERSPAHLTLPGPKGFVNYAFQSTNLITAFCAFYMWPHLFANFFSARNGDVIRRQAIFVPLYNLIALSFTLVGFAGVLVVSGIKPDTVMVEMIRRVAPLWVVALFCAGAISASMVTGAACVLAAAATAANDLIQPRFPMPDAQLRKLVQGLIFAVTAAAYGLALLEPALIVYIILMAYAVTAQFFPAVVVTFYFPRVTSRAVIAGLLGGLGTAAIFVFRLVEPPYNIHPGFLGLCVNVPVLALLSMVPSKRLQKRAIAPPIDAQERG